MAIRCYIVDIDGTVANAAHRVHHIKKSPKDWDSFHAGVHLDKPHMHMWTLLRHLQDSGVDFVYVSGRPERNREATLKWLYDHEFPYASALYMRAEKDFRDDSIVKSELLDKLLAEGWSPIMAFDDRDRVVKMWRERGVPCLQVAEGNF